MEPIDLADYLVTAEAVLGVPADQLLGVISVSLAESALAAPYASFGGHDFYPDPIDRIAILGSRVARNHAIYVDGNKRVALLLMLEAMARHGVELVDCDDNQLAEQIELVAESGEHEPAFVAWLRQHVA